MHDRLREYLHVRPSFRHAYGCTPDWPRMRHLVKDAQDTFDNLRHNCSRFSQACQSTMVTTAWHRMFLCTLACTLIACRPPSSTTEEIAALRQLVQAEAEAARAHDIERLESLWAEEGLVRDANHTPGDQSDDRVWIGRDAVMTRYTSLLFYLPLDGAGPTDLEITVNGDKATITATTRIGNEISPRGERWTFVRRAGRWQIASITFNLEPR